MAEISLLMDARRFGAAIQRLIDKIQLGPKIGGEMTDNGVELLGFGDPLKYPVAGRNRDSREPMIGGVLVGDAEILWDD